MAIIYSYPLNLNILDTDIIIGTSTQLVNGRPKNQTKSFKIADLANYFIPTLQQVVNVGNTIVVPVSRPSGIDITLANLETVYQNGVSVTIPNQTGTPYPTYYSAPDAYMAYINGQSPGTLTGHVTGFGVEAHGSDNYSFWSNHYSDITTSYHSIFNNYDGATSSFVEYRNATTGAGSVPVYKIDYLGNVTGNSFMAAGKVLIGTTDAGQPTYGSNPHLVVTSPYAGGSVGGVMDLRNLSPNIVANDLLGRIQFTGKGDAPIGYTGCAIEGIAAGTAATGTNSGGILIFKTAANAAGASPIEKMRISQNGTVRPGNDNTSSLGESGIRWSSVWAANGTIQTSDEREKKDIVDSDLGLDFVSKLRPVSFKWKVGKNEVKSELDGLDEEGNPKTKIVVTPIEGKRTHYGLIAQEVETLLDGKDFGGFIHDPETDIKGLRYDQFIPVLINAIKELKAEIEILKAK